MKKRFLLMASLITAITLTSCDVSLGTLIGSENINYNGGSHSNSINSTNSDSTVESSLIESSSSVSSFNTFNSDSISSTVSSSSIESTCPPCEVSVCQDSLDVAQFQDLLIATRDKTRDANVLIEVNYYTKFGPVTELVMTSTGSGVIYKQESNYYYALSNFHVFGEINNYSLYQVKAITMSGDKVAASLVDYDSAIDLAVIRFDSTSLSNVNVYDVDARKDYPLNTDEFVLAIGNPSAIEGNVTFGQFIKMTNIANVDYQVIQHSALIYSGNRVEH
jgi:S1-C subfamily serine protease